MLENLKKNTQRKLIERTSKNNNRKHNKENYLKLVGSITSKLMFCKELK